MAYGKRPTLVLVAALISSAGFLVSDAFLSSSIRKVDYSITSTRQAASDVTVAAPAKGEFSAPPEEILKRRNLAIIAHPDAGKTTLTEKLLLYGGALQQAGAVKTRAERSMRQRLLTYP